MMMAAKDDDDGLCYILWGAPPRIHVVFSRHQNALRFLSGASEF